MMDGSNLRSQPVIEVRDLWKEYPAGDETVVALRDITLNIHRGEICCIFGPSGSGKSTLLNQLSGLEKPTRGEVLIGGVPISRLSETQLTNFRQRHLGFVFQSYNLLPNLTATENVALPLMFRGVPKPQREQAARELLARVGLSHRLNHFPSQMSGGQQQRVALARALAVKPRVLLLDEPLSALDAKVRVQLRDQIRRIQLTTGTTTVFVTHDQEEALAVADRIGVMNKGKIEQIAAPQNLYQRPATEYVATFIGLTNRLPGASNGDEAVVFGQRVPLLAGSAKGDSVAVLVRPENLTLALAGSSDSHVGERARVEVIHFLGSLVRVDTVITSGEYQRWNKGEQLKATVQLPASELPAGLAVGDDVIVTPRPVAALAC